MSGGLWLPDGPVLKAFELELVPAKAAPFVPSGLLLMGVARADAVMAARAANFLPLDPANGRLAVSSMAAPAAPGTTSQVAVEVAVAGDNAVIPAPGAGLRIYVLAYELLTRGNVSVRFKSGVGGGATNLSGQFTPAAGALQMALSFNGGLEAPLFASPAEAFNIFLGGAVAIDGFIKYVVAA